MEAIGLAAYDLALTGSFTDLRNNGGATHEARDHPPTPIRTRSFSPLSLA